MAAAVPIILFLSFVTLVVGGAIITAVSFICFWITVAFFLALVPTLLFTAVVASILFALTVATAAFGWMVYRILVDDDPNQSLSGGQRWSLNRSKVAYKKPSISDKINHRFESKEMSDKVIGSRDVRLGNEANQIEHEIKQEVEDEAEDQEHLATKDHYARGEIGIASPLGLTLEDQTK